MVIQKDTPPSSNIIDIDLYHCKRSFRKTTPISTLLIVVSARDHYGYINNVLRRGVSFSIEI